MKKIQIVDPNHVYMMWPVLEPFFKRSEEFGAGDSTVDQIKTSLAKNYHILFVVTDDEQNNEVIGAFAVELINYTNHRVAHTVAMGGRGILDKETIEQYETWARLQGCTKIRAWAKDAQARLYRMKMGLEKTMNVVEKLL
jgi:hypothetical protein